MILFRASLLPSKASLGLAWDLGKFWLFNMVLCLADIITDIYAACRYLRAKSILKTMVKNGHVVILVAATRDHYYGCLTLLLVFLPFLISLVKDVFLIVTRKRPFEIKSFQSFYHLPFVQIMKHYGFFKRVNEKARKMKELKDFENNFFEMIDNCFPDKFKSDGNLFWSEFCDKLKQFHEEQEKKKGKGYGPHLWKDLKSSHSGKIKDFKKWMKTGIRNCEVKYKKENADLQTAIQEFKLIEIFFESGPQFLLQLAILIYEDPLFQNEDSTSPLKLILLATSLLSVVMVISSTLLSMPYYMETPYSMSLQKESPFQCWKNWLVVLPIMFSISTPRLILLGIELAMCTGQCVFIIPLILICYFLLYWMVKQNCCSPKLSKTYRLLR